MPHEPLIDVNVARGSADAVARWVAATEVSTMCATGCALRRPDGAYATAFGGDVDTLFDLASVTKPMTALAFARAGISRRAPLASLLPLARGTASADVPIELLLAHRAGLVDHVPAYLPLVTGAPFDRELALVDAANKRRDDARGEIPEEGFAPVYSDLGYALVGEALASHFAEKDAGSVIDQLVVSTLPYSSELGSARDLEARGIDVIAKSAPTEDVPWRGGVIRGRVHDENAWALTGAGASGHAGMFGTVRATLAFGCACLDAIIHHNGPFALSGGANPANDFSWLARTRPGGTLRAGFDGKSETGSSAGTICGPRTFGHLGFTGTSLWIDPDLDAVVVLLTNRVHPTRNNTKIREARPRAHDALFALARASRIV